MGRLTNVTFQYPDVFLAALGGLGGFVLGTSHVDVAGGLAAGLVAAFFTVLIGNLQPVEPSRGPHQ
jgi:uncharacterized membrane protein YccC